MVFDSRSRTWTIACAALVLLLSTLDAQAKRPRPEGPTSIDDRLSAWHLHQRMDEDSLFRGLTWRCVGPIAMGGRLVDIEVHPAEPYTFYVAYASGGLWRTENNGLSFDPLFDEQPTMIMGDVAIDPNDPDVLWVGTGENNSSRSSYGGLGVFRSDDGGESWHWKGLGDTDRIGRILVDPRDSDVVLVAALGRLYTKSGDRGIYRSEDGGATWQRVLEGTGWTGFIDLVRHPTDPEIVYAAAWERSRRPHDFVEGGSGTGIYRSDDGGRTWTRLEGGFPQGRDAGRIGLAVSAASPSTVYAFLDNQQMLPEEQWDLGGAAITAKRLRTMSREEFLRQDPEEIESFVRSADLHPSISGEKLTQMVRDGEVTLEQILATLTDANAGLFDTDIEGPQVWRSDDRGTTWHKTHDEPIREMVYTYGYYFGQIRVSPTDVDRIYIMGVPILRSDDGGATWIGLDDRVVHVDYQSMVIDDEHHDRVMVGNDGGLAMSWDGGLTWLEFNKNPVGQFYTIHVDMDEPYNIYGGLQDNGTWKGPSTAEPDDARAWRFLNGGDGFYVQTDDRDGTTYAGFQFGYYTRIDPDGSRHRVRPRNQLDEPALRYNWMTPIQLSSHNQDIVYFGANMLFRSMDKGETWVAISGDLTRTRDRGDVPFGTITSIDESTHHFGEIYVGTDDGQLWRTRDGGATWTDISDGVVRDRWITRVVVSTHDEARVYASLNGYRDDDMAAYVYRSDDRGASWTSIADGLPAEPVNVIREDPENEDVLYVGTDRGAYVSLDRGGSWMALSGGIPNVPVHDLVVHPRDKDLVAGTHGRSVWVLDVEPIQLLDDELRAKVVHLYELDEVQASRGWRGVPSEWFYRPDEDDPSHTVRLWSKEGGVASFDVLDADGRVLRTFERELLRGVNQFEWDLRLDPDLAVAAERERIETEDTEAEEPIERTLADWPWSEAQRLGYPMYVTAGEYTLRVTQGDATAEAAFTVKAPPAREPRTTGPLTRPGKLHP